MHIESVFLKNFRCFGLDGQKIELEVGVTALVGANGSGKTALMTALMRLFGATASQRAIVERDFHNSAERDRRADGDTLTIEVVLSFPELGEGAHSDGQTGVPEFFSQMSVAGKGARPKVRIVLRAVWRDDGTAEGVIEEDIRWIPTLGEDYEWHDCRRVAPIERGTIQVVYIPAARNNAEPIKNLLSGRLWRAARWSDELRDTIERGSREVQAQFEGEKAAGFVSKRLEKRWQQLYRADTDTKPLLKLIDDNVSDLVRRAEFMFHPNEAGNARPFAELSDGQRSLFHIALTAATLEIERDALALATDKAVFDQDKIKRVHLTLLAIEEPENSLSPYFLSRIIGQTREIAALPTAQVIVSSHSAGLLSRIEPEEVRYFRVDRTVQVATIRKLTLPPCEDEASRYVRLAVKSYPELFFARLVILGEGDSERIVIPRIAEAMGVPLDTSFVPVVPLGGRYPAHFWRLLNDLDIPHATLLDLDFGRQHGGAKAVQTAVAILNEVGVDLDSDFLVDFSKVGELTDDDFVQDFEQNNWLQALAQYGVFFSDPLDLDFSMLSTFPDAYQQPNPGGRGPRLTPESIAEKKRVSLKSGGNPGAYDEDWSTAFAWYPYLFLSHSKPERHLSALSKIAEDKLAESAPAELKALINFVNAKIIPGGKA